MAPAAPKAGARKRNRKRKRRAYTSSSSSDDASDSDSSAASAASPQKKPPAPAKPEAPTDDSEDSGSSSDSSSSSEDSDEDSDEDAGQLIATPADAASAPKKPARRPRSPSPPPTKRDIPPFLPPTSAPGAAEKEQALRDNFRRFWMASIAEGFKDDLEEIRKEPNLGPSRLALLIDSLASGADVFGAEGDVNEMEVVLNADS
ncbi:hypothetical protein CONPUDRAFT_89449 [Coniophora puteana RWD-64-598 SS2]|uniref:Ribosome assembly protein 3 n=1 Tax=Coniophora puteana (strain RWD-64-598) TaxID=741705 RepID=A0A5M3MS32_CONPW|nr:uncharacterized protein CONPUDRAFT_89449 [Coniophora puteana RWD-64-598 SS2]EIW81910.1 hypothetical protein CONPUDRAFT_89449 [Coniophora puteana RWD-64-598 SS2]